jgi:hypothetical protein
MDLLVDIGSITGALVGLMLVGLWGYYLIMEDEDD